MSPIERPGWLPSDLTDENGGELRRALDEIERELERRRTELPEDDAPDQEVDIVEGYEFTGEYSPKLPKRNR